MSVDIGVVGVPGKLCFYGTSCNIRIYSNSIAAAPLFGIRGSNGYSIRAWYQFELGAEAVMIAAAAIIG